ncbi:MAG: ABC transporter permease subunit [Actinobacteria bacterium]|uniref:Unannotated protein n=1 Tax=freshwater metagenome TaxID=449393 RepID=A0A6J7FTZ7_9ZZZZ|nr:ABC transporter permease subunit [Actinomycetota bacterium]MSW90601.1 ABC transporter permease subunit [Actinomycetota bacterium]MSX87035.1 ABC transporter permease subunit [Actinomycetota bacterium]MSY71795.1 ABC transporter permease subunit [Actinomycetota bacterium]
MRLFGLRLLQLIPVLLIVTLATFLLTEFLPGDPVYDILGPEARPEQIALVRQQLDLDAPLPSRYVSWVSDALQGDLGKSLITGRSVSATLRQRMPVNLEIAVLTQLLALLVAIPLGAWSAYRAGRRFDRAVTTTSFGVVAVPPFLSALILVAIVAYKLRLLPNTGWTPIGQGIGENLRYIALPVVTLALTEIAVYSQLLRSDMAATLQEDYVLAARARGLSNRHVLMREALRPSSFSLITLAGVNLGRLIGGTVIIERIFGLPGLGTAITQAIPAKDYTVLQGGVLLLAVAYLLINLLVDVSYTFLDPRIKRHG